MHFYINLQLPDVYKVLTMKRIVNETIKMNNNSNKDIVKDTIVKEQGRRRTHKQSLTIEEHKFKYVLIQ